MFGQGMADDCDCKREQPKLKRNRKNIRYGQSIVITVDAESMLPFEFLKPKKMEVKTN